MPAHYTLHGAFLLPAHSRIFIAWFLCVPNYTADRFLKRKKEFGKEQTSQRQGQQLSWKCLLFSSA